MKENTEISVKITEIIDSTGLSKNEFSKRLGYERAQTIYDIANGKSAPSYEFFHRLFNSEFADSISCQYLFVDDAKSSKIRRAITGPYEKAKEVLGRNLVSEDSLEYSDKVDQDIKLENKYLTKKVSHLTEEVNMLQEMLNNYRKRV